MERKLATVLFVDLVDSTALVAATDPEVVRRRVTEFFDNVARCVAAHGGIVEKFAGDAVLAGFGVAQAHEDDAERAVRAALGILAEVERLGLEARIGLEAGEVVVEDTESTFATGEAVNLAARLQQAASPGEILMGPAAHRLTLDRVEVEDAGPLELRGVAAPLRVWRVLRAIGTPLSATRPALRARLIGRDAELELLENTFARTIRDRRAHVFTIFGEPGVGKSRLAREFLDAVERATVLNGRCLPYGESITFWPLAEMVKQAAGIADDDPPEVAFEKLRACCEEEAVADLLALAAGLLEALEGERSPEEITWAAREFAEKLGEASGQPVILAFEDIHWAEEPLLDLIEHLSAWVRAPVLLLCLARPELLDHRPGWGGGRVRATAIELEPLGQNESEELLDELLAAADGRLNAPERQALLEKTEGNPLFVEETIRMLVEEPSGNGRADRIPDSLQAIIAARIDRLPALEKTLLQRAAVIGRIFWENALAHLSPETGDLRPPLEDLLLREFLLDEQRTSITGERAFRFKHVLIREVAYAGLSKSARTEYHRGFADWLRERAGDDLLEIRAHHLEQAAGLLAELDGQAPVELASEAAEALTAAGRRAIAREAYTAARKLLVRALELEPTLKRRYLAARASWRLGDYGTVAVEMERVRADAAEGGEYSLEARALTGLAEAALQLDGDVGRAEAAVDRALALLEGETDPDAQFDALIARASVGVWRSDLDAVTRYLELAFGIGLAAARKDLQTIAAQALVQIRILMRGELAEAETIYEEVRVQMAEVGHHALVAHILVKLAWLACEREDEKRAEKLLREALRLYAQLGTRASLPQVQAVLAMVLARQGKVDEAERLALEAKEHATPEDPENPVLIPLSVASVRAAQGRDAEAEALFREAIAAAAASEFRLLERDPLRELSRFLGERGREDEAAAYDARLAELTPALSTAQIA